MKIFNKIICCSVLHSCNIVALPCVIFGYLNGRKSPSNIFLIGDGYFIAARSVVTCIHISQIYPCVITRLCSNSEHYHFNKIRIWTIQVRNNLVSAILFQRLVLLWFHSQTVSPLQTFTSQQNTDTNNLSKMIKIIREWAYMLLMLTLKFYNNLLLFSLYPRLHFTCVYYLLLFYTLLLRILHFILLFTFVNA